MKWLLIIFLLLHSYDALYARNLGQAGIDSLLAELSSDNYRNKEDTNKVKLLTEVTHQYMSADPDKALIYAQEALTISDKLEWKSGDANAYFLLAWIYRSKSEYAKALEYANLSLQIWEELNQKRDIALVYQIMSIIYLEQSDYPQALDFGLRSLNISEEIKDKRLIGGNLTNIGIIYDDQGNYTGAMEYHTKALKNFEELNEKYPIATALSNIGLIYKEEKNYPMALETQFKALKISESINNEHTISKNDEYIGEIYKETKEYSKALEFLLKAEKINDELGDKTGKAENLQTIGLTFLAAATDSENVKDGGNLISSKPGNLQKAIESLSDAAAIHQEIGNLKDLSENYRDLSTAWEQSGNDVKALAYHKLYMTYKDSVFSAQNRIKLANLETKRELELKDKQIQLDMAKKRMENIFYIAGIVLLLLVIIFIYRNYSLQIKSNKLLSREKKISEDLLLNILPVEVAKELKEKGSASAKNFDNVTVLFADFVNFTAAGERMTAHELVSELDVCFKAFDDIIGKYNIEKIKTIGDAYLAVSGLPVPDSAHAEHIVNAALEINSFLQERKAMPGDNTFLARIGIHSGDVVAGIVGSRKFAYDIWGDTVNIAARMEQTSEEGKINISQATYELIQNSFICTYRGEIDAKNKGKLGMYFVDGLKNET